MKEISNSTLALLVVVAIVVSVFGTLLSLSKLNEFGGAEGITGMFSATATGGANLSVTETVSIQIIAIGADTNLSLIQLGTLNINATTASDDVNDWWKVENDGSVNVSIEITSYTVAGGGNPYGSGTYKGNQGFGPFTTTSIDSTGCVNPSTLIHTCFQVKCNGTDTGGNCTNIYYPLDNQTGGLNRKLVYDLSFVDTSDTAVFGVNVTVPLGESPGTKIQHVSIIAANSES